MGSPTAVLGQQLERRGDQEVYVGAVESAKLGYGQAIDAYLEARDFEAAIRTCRKLIRLAPDVVRTHYTLAYLLVGKRENAEAAEVIRQYTEAVVRAGAQEHAIPRLVLLAHVTDDPALHGAIGEALARLGATELGQQTTRRAEALSRGDSGHLLSAGERWEHLLRVALRDQ